MPDIKKSYQITNIPLDNIYQESLEILKNLGASDIKENITNSAVKEIKAMIPSIWGWGGMNISIRLEQTPNNVLLILNGYIAQLGASPLTKKMDEFLLQLQSALKAKYNCSFEYEKLTQFLPKYKLSINNKDKKIFIVIIIIIFFVTVIGELQGPKFELLITCVVVLIGYMLGKKYLKK